MGFQDKVAAWTVECFGEEIAQAKTERSYRFIEEAIELVQACGTSKEDVLKWVDYVYNRPVGELPQEVGGVMITLAALCASHKVDMLDQGWTEYERINTPELIEKIRAKQVSKKVIVAEEDPPELGDEFFANAKRGLVPATTREEMVAKMRAVRQAYIDGGGYPFSLEEIGLAHDLDVDPGEVRIGYMCLVDYDYELGEQGPSDGSKFYPSLETLEENRICIPQCGWAKVAVIKLDQRAGDPTAKI